MTSNFGEINDIFIETKSTPKKLIPILKSSTKIPKLVIYLNDNKINYKNKINTLSQLIPLFKANKNILLLFAEKGTSNNSPNLFKVLTKLYLDKNANKEDLSKIEELINIFLNNIPIPKTVIEYIYQKLTNFFNEEKGVNPATDTKELSRYFKILNIFYGSGIPKISEKPVKEIKNYFYFNGKDSKLNFVLNKNSKNLNSDFPTFEYGFTFIFWLYIKKDLLENYFSNFSSTVITLVNISIVGHSIQLILKNINSILIMLDKKEIGKINLSGNFKYDEWNFICFYMTQRIKAKQSAYIKLVINNSKDLVNYKLSDDFPFSEIINSIYLFENLIGKVSSILFFSFDIDMKLLDFLRNNYKRGFYKNKYLFHFSYLNDKDYFKDIKNYKYCLKYKKEKTPLKFLNINFRSQSIKNLMVFFCPFTYNKNTKSVDDIFGHFSGVLSENDGIILFKNYNKSLEYLGGLNNILPIGELMLINKETNLLTEEAFEKFMNILQTIFCNNNLHNLSEAYSHNFFSTLALFLERLPDNIYN